jgi:hypothetical protein
MGFKVEAMFSFSCDSCGREVKRSTFASAVLYRSNPDAYMVEDIFMPLPDEWKQKGKGFVCDGCKDD